MNTGERRTWKLPRIVEIDNIIECKAQLMGLRDAVATEVVLDVEDVVAVDAAGLQLLAAFVSSVHLAGGRVEWENLSVPLYQAAHSLGLEDVLRL